MRSSALGAYVPCGKSSMPWMTAHGVAAPVSTAVGASARNSSNLVSMHTTRPVLHLAKALFGVVRLRIVGVPWA